jgi:hypothetical protein
MNFNFNPIENKQQISLGMLGIKKDRRSAKRTSGVFPLDSGKLEDGRSKENY